MITIAQQILHNRLLNLFPKVKSSKSLNLSIFNFEIIYHQDLADVVKSLVETLGVGRFTLVGHDWGGAICWTFAALYPHLLDNLIICNCPHMVAIR